MKKTKNKKSIHDQVMKRIKKDKIKMKPRVYFVIGSLALGVGIAGTLAVAGFFINMIVFRLRMQGPLGYLKFGRLGRSVFVEIFPWRSLALAVIGMGIGLWLWKQYGVSYKRSFVGVVLATISLVLVLGLFLDRTGVNEKLGKQRLAEPLYKMRFATDNWLVGEIIEVADKQLEIETPDGERITVNWDEKTKFPLGSEFEIGDKVRVVGEKQGDEFMAKGIGKGGLRWNQDFSKGIKNGKRRLLR